MKRKFEEITDWNSLMDFWNEYHRVRVIPAIRAMSQTERKEINIWINKLRNPMKWAKYDIVKTVVGEIMQILEKDESDMLS